MKVWHWVAIAAGVVTVGYIAAAGPKAPNPAPPAEPRIPRKRILVPTPKVPLAQRTNTPDSPRRPVDWTGIVLDPSETSRLRDWFEEISGLKPLGEELAYRMTIRSDPTLSQMSGLSFGWPSGVRLLGWGADQFVQAVEVQPVSGDKRPFVPEMKVGTPGPFYVVISLSDRSRNVCKDIRNIAYTPISQGPSFFGKLSFFDGKDVISDMDGFERVEGWHSVVLRSSTVTPAKAHQET